MSTRFFTNSKENTVQEKFKGVFTYAKVTAFDALVGYFRSYEHFKIREYPKDAGRSGYWRGLTLIIYL